MNLNEIIPFKGLGDLEFGFTREQVHELLGLNFSSFQHGADTILADYYQELRLRLFYDALDKLEFIEVYPNSQSFVNLRYDNISLFDSTLKNNIATLRKKGHKLFFEQAGGYFFPELGFLIYAPYPPNISNVSIYRKGYYASISRDK